jgi:hypothetical protein
VRQLLRFPNPVNEVAARLVAAGVVVMAVLVAVAQQWWVLVPLTYGFAARVASGPRFSPLALFVTRVVVPALDAPPRLVPGPPKRFAQGVGLLFATTASMAHLAGADTLSRATAGALAGAATLEAVLGLCLGCRIFATLMRVGLIPAEVCDACNNVGSRLRRA